MKWRLLAALALLVSLGHEVRANPVDVKLEVVEPEVVQPEEGEAAEEQKLPRFRAVLTRRPGLTKKDFTLKLLGAQPPLEIEAAEAVTFKDSDEPMTLIVLVQGNFRWMGNETYGDPEEGTIYDGAFKGLAPAIETLAQMGPRGSRAGLLVYGGEVKVKQALGAATDLNGSALGSQQAYEDHISRPLIAGLTESWKIFTKPEEAENRKILVVIGDGFDDNADIAGPLRKAIDDFRTAGVEIYTIHYAASMEDGPQGQQNMKRLGYSGDYNATSRGEFSTYAGNIAQLVGAKYYVDFPGDEVTFDGKDHEFVVVAAGEESEPILLGLPLVEPPVEEGRSLWWLWLLIILVVCIVIIAIILVRRRRASARVPEPAAPEPPPPGPQRTIMLGIGGSDDAMPIVGWVVPLEGPNQYQTFKLLQGATKLGTGGEAHIVIDDSFMSTEHAEIVCSAGGFVLKDLGSTNGTFFNGNRVSVHELVDNDVFRLGKTDFKFKSIN